MCLYQKELNYEFNEKGKKKLIWNQKFNKYLPSIIIPCGKCIECMFRYSNEWALRIMLESTLHKDTCMITLTYDDDHISFDGSLVPRDMTLFIKRLRKSLKDIKIRYFYCGEYGKKLSRPHYHIIIFGWIPKDLDKFFVKKNHQVYISNFVSKIWKNGFVTVEDLNINSARYCAKYLQKLQIPKDFNLIKPFTRMSNRPGISFGFFDSKIYDVDEIYYDGKSYPVFRYFDKIAERNGIDLTFIKEKRIDSFQLFRRNEIELDYFRKKYKRKFDL